jgi:hypothetical protein
LQFILKSERIARNTEQSRSTGCGVRQMNAALLLLATSLLRLADGSLETGPLIFKHLVAGFAISETKIFEQYWG